MLLRSVWESATPLCMNYISTSTKKSMVTKCGRVFTYHEELLPVKPRDSLITWYFEITCLTKNIVSTTTMPMTTKLGKLMTYHEGLLTIKSQHPLIT